MTTYITIAERLATLAKNYQQGIIIDAVFVKQLATLAHQAHLTQNELSVRASHRASNDWRQYAADTAMVQWCEAHDCSLPGKLPWRWCADQKLGEIVGIPGSRGIPRVTNGVEVIIELEGGGVFIGHNNWFEADAASINYNALKRQARAKRVRKVSKTAKLKELFATKTIVSNEEILALLQ